MYGGVGVLGKIPISSNFFRWSAERVDRRGGHLVAKVGTSKAGGTISQQAAVQSVACHGRPLKRRRRNNFIGILNRLFGDFI
jgi:hypothetical protein